MNKRVATLATTTVLFAGSSAWLAYRLYGRGTEIEPTAATAPGPTAVHPMPVEKLPATPPAVAPTRPGSNAVRESVIDLEGNGRQMMAERARTMLPDFDDPQKRQKMVDDAKGALKEGCRLMDVGRGYRDTQLQEVAALIGSDKERRFEEFQMSMSERMSMPTLRGRFDDATRLTDDQAERLIVALVDVRQRAEQELASGGSGPNEYNGGVFAFVYPNDSKGVDAQLTEAAEYGKRVHDRAAQILNPAQLKIFDDARAESLRNLEFMLRQPKSDSR
jgi:hypothetical protein